MGSNARSCAFHRPGRVEAWESQTGERGPEKPIARSFSLCEKQVWIQADTTKKSAGALSGSWRVRFRCCTSIGADCAFSPGSSTTIVEHIEKRSNLARQGALRDWPHHYFTRSIILSRAVSRARSKCGSRSELSLGRGPSIAIAHKARPFGLSNAHPTLRMPGVNSSLSRA